MSKVILSLMLINVSFNYIIAQEAVNNIALQKKDSIINTPTVNEFTPRSHWSVGIKGGINYFRIASSTVTRSEQFHLTLGGTLEYTINTLVGVGLEYNYNPFDTRYHINSTTNGNLTGTAQDAILYGSVNLSNLLIPYRTGKSKFNVYGIGGVGLAFYNYSLNSAPNESDQSATAKLALDVEYNLSKSFSLGAEAGYQYYNWKLEQVNTIYNTEAATATIGLRYKFGATGDKKHVRNISISDYYPKPAPVMIVKTENNNNPGNDNKEMLARLKALENDNDTLNSKIKKLNENLLALSAKKEDDGIITFQNIEFEFGSDKLNASSYPVLDQITATLKNHPASFRLSVAGYTDYIGSDEFNRTLSVKRAYAVKAYILTKNIPSSNIFIAGYGKENPVAPNDTEAGRKKNRRVEFQIIK